MDLYAGYICPVRGIADLQAPDPRVLGETAVRVRAMGITGLVLPVLEEALLQALRSRVAYLDGLILALDRAEDAGMRVRLRAPARRVLGCDFAPSYLVRPGGDPEGPLVFTGGKLRRLSPYAWWEDMSVVQRRVRLFRELVGAIEGHPALGGYILLDRDLDGVRPSADAAETLLRTLLAELEEGEEGGPSAFLGIGWEEVLDPGLVRGLSRYVRGLFVGGLETLSDGPVRGRGAGTFVSVMAQWLFGLPVVSEPGRFKMEELPRGDALLEALLTLARRGPEGLCFATLRDPEPWLADAPPFSLDKDLCCMGLMDRGGRPKGDLEAMLALLSVEKGGEERDAWIDIRPEAYAEDPEGHLRRLWDRFLERT